VSFGSDEKPCKPVLGFVKLSGFLPALLFFKWKLYYENENAKRRLPAPCLLVSNHKKLSDYVLYMMVFFGRTLRILIAEVMYNKGKGFARFLNMLGGIRVDRNAFDFGFIARTLQALDNGEVVAVFPQGRLPVGDKEWPFKPSVSYIALRTFAPIIPVFTDGSYGLLKRAHVMIGEAIDIREWTDEKEPDGAEIERLTQVLQDKVFALGEELKRRTAVK